MARGLILNERTGKTIKIGAATYNRLVLEGYTPDRAAGVLTPPGASAKPGGESQFFSIVCQPLKLKLDAGDVH